jgi:hypothetical protein
MPWLAQVVLIALLIWAVAEGSWPLAGLSVLALLVSVYVMRRRAGGG